MTEKATDKTTDSTLRSRAREILDSSVEPDIDLAKLSPTEIAGLIQELRVHQIELKMQNDELRRIQEALESVKNRYTDLYDYAPVGYLTVNDKGVITAANLTTATLLSEPRGSLVGRYFSRLIHREDMDIWYFQMKRFLESENLQAIFLRLEKSNGSWFWANLECIPVSGDKGSAREMRIAVIDITERKRAEDNLRQLNETLEQQVVERTRVAEARAARLQALTVELIDAEEKERRRLADILHDDLQQILAAAALQLESAGNKLPSNIEIKNVSNLLRESINKSRHLAHDLSPPMLYRFGLAPALDWLVQRMKKLFDLYVDLEVTSPEQFKNTHFNTFLFRAAQELLLNVVKHTNEKTAIVRLSASTDSLTMTVTDQGRGFDPGILDLTVKKTGFGLLSIQERANFIGGTLKIESAEGKGSCFTLTLPVHSEITTMPERRKTGRGSPPSPDAGVIKPGGSIRVMLADDHVVMRKGLAGLINSRPDILVVGEAADGAEAVRQALLLKPDVVLMDISMPVMDGVEATRHIKASMPGVRVIGLSMHEETQVSDAMREAGADAFLTKTAPSSEVLRTIYRTGHQEK